MADKKRFLLRIDPAIHRALEKWAADDLRSVNAQIEFLVKESLRRAGRLPKAGGGGDHAGMEKGAAGAPEEGEVEGA